MRQFKCEHYFSIGRGFGQVRNAMADVDADRLEVVSFLMQYDEVKNRLLAIKDIWMNPVAASLLQGASSGVGLAIMDGRIKASNEHPEESPREFDLDQKKLHTALAEMECSPYLF